jgi:hypothetical protein
LGRIRSLNSATRRAALSLSLLLGLATAICYATRSDLCAAVTVFPPWLWPVPGLLLALFAFRRRERNRAVWGVAAVWLVYVLAFAEEPASLLRRSPWDGAEWHGPRDKWARLVRVVSLNCAGGSPEAAAEVVAWKPEIVLLQESPGRPDVERLARQLWGAEAGVTVGPDASILARGTLLPAVLPREERVFFVQARARLSSGVRAEVISLRLIPPLVRNDLWSPDCWREQTANRRARREQLRLVARRIASVPRDIPLLVGGDFNAPAGDAAFRLLQPRLYDTFKRAGIGWGNTIVNEFPFARIDQVWASEPIRAGAVQARRTQYSDHRMVVCDLLVPIS